MLVPATATPVPHGANNSNPPPQTLPIILAHADKIESRKSELLQKNKWLLRGIVATVILGVVMLWLMIIELKGKLETTITKTNTHKEFVDKTILTLTPVHNSIKILSTQIEENSKTPEASDAATAYAKTLRTLANSQMPTRDIAAEIEKAEQHLASFQNKLKQFDSGLSKQIKDSDLAISDLKEKLSSTPPPNLTSILLVELSVRIGFLILTIYLAQLFLGIYKYNTQLIAHYTACADAILLSINEKAALLDAGTFILTSKVLSTNSLNFGNPEINPVKEIGEVAKIIADLKK